LLGNLPFRPSFSSSHERNYDLRSQDDATENKLYL
jgi:hypothetical protein